MTYLEVLVGHTAFHGGEALTYSHSSSLPQGSIVLVPLRSKQVMGVVRAEVGKPAFAAKAITQVPDLPPIPVQLLSLLDWIREYYPSPLGVITQLFLPKDLPKKPVGTLPAAAEIHTAQLPDLTDDQSATLQKIRSDGTYLLHGETGTGKTRVYIELAKRAITAGKSVIILTPEIGLTPQLALDFQKVFSSRVLVIHSQLTQVTRQRLWVSILKQTEPMVIIGARSALFSPVSNIGLIVMDEAHETAYKQDQAPYYHTARVVGKLAELSEAPLILGTATPLISDYYMATEKKRPILRMQQTAVGDTDPLRQCSVIDLRDRSKFTKKTHLSDELIKAIDLCLQKGEQSLLFLNRRGTARIIFCEKCGWQAECPHCDLPLIYHGDKHVMRCHGCNFTASSPGSCPNCHNASVIFKSIGTKAIVDEVQRLFPDARVIRFDTDNKKDERIEQQYELVKDGGVDIIIGTQTIAKGLDLPNLSLVGIIIADTSLYFPDFSAQERTYQLLSQVIGRVGRGHKESKVIIQTYAPDSFVLRAILNKDWDSFYSQEIQERKAFTFPPFCYLLKLECRRASSHSAERAALAFAQQITQAGLRVKVEGPAPSFHEKKQNKYGWQLVIKAKKREELLGVIKILPSGWSYDIDPMNLL